MRQTCIIVVAILAVGIIFAVVLGITLGVRQMGKEPTRTSERTGQARPGTSQNDQSGSGGVTEGGKPGGGTTTLQGTQTGGGTTTPQGGTTGDETSSSTAKSPYDTYRITAAQTPVTTCSKLATDIIIGKSGSAVDAGIAAMICLGVTRPFGSGIGGGGFLTIYDTPKGTQNRSIVTITAREVLPAAGSATFYSDNNDISSIYGAKAIGVPGELMGMRKAWEMFGRVPWRDLFTKAIDLAENGFEITESTIAVLEETEKNKDKIDKSIRDLYVLRNGSLIKAGHILRRPKLAKTLQRIAEDPYSFYNGSLADDIVKELTARDGVITRDDLAGYKARIRTPISGKLPSLNLTMYSPEPPSSGVILQYILRILDGFGFDNKSLENVTTRGTTYHRFIETLKFGFGKRTALGDKDFVNITEVLKNITDADLIDAVRKRINDSATYDYPYYEPAYEVQNDAGTAHVSILAPDGGAFASTTTINGLFGAGVLGNITGIIYNNEMDDFAKPGETDMFGIPAAPNNYPAPGKMPMSSMSPSIFLTDSGEVAYIAGASGGPYILTSVSQVALQALFIGLDLGTATDISRLHHQLLPNHIEYEADIEKGLMEELVKRGHTFKLRGFLKGVTGAIKNRCLLTRRSFCGSCIEAVEDYREKSGSPSGY